MWPTSPGFTAALHSSSRRWSTRVEVLAGADRLATLTTVESGAVDIDNVAVRRSLDLTVLDPTGAITPASARDMLAPRGTEIRVWRGLHVGGQPEWVPLGVFGVVDPQVSAHGGGTVIKLTGRDRVDAVRVRRFAAPWSIARGTPTAKAISDIVTSRLDVPVRITATGSTTPEVVYDALSDPWDAVRELASADSLTAFFDPLGTFVVAPDDEALTDVTYSPGPGSMLVDSSRTISAENVYSGVIVRGEHPDYPPVVAEVWDTDPASPTYYLGPFGRRPYGFTSSIITTQAQALAAGQSILPRVTRMRQTAELHTIGHPGHDVADVVRVDDQASRTSGLWAVQGGNVPLRPNGGPIRLKLQEALGA